MITSPEEHMEALQDAAELIDTQRQLQQLQQQVQGFGQGGTDLEQLGATPGHVPGIQSELAERQARQAGAGGGAQPRQPLQAPAPPGALGQAEPAAAAPEADPIRASMDKHLAAMKPVRTRDEGGLVKWKDLGKQPGFANATPIKGIPQKSGDSDVQKEVLGKLRRIAKDEGPMAAIQYARDVLGVEYDEAMAKRVGAGL
jgi:hypothetical protein